jgi:Protein of unknown function (DUF2934)
MKSTSHNTSFDSSHRPSETSRQQQIETRAYKLYEQRGREHGRDVEDWLQAEGEINIETSVPQRVEAIAA